MGILLYKNMRNGLASTNVIDKCQYKIQKKKQDKYMAQIIPQRKQTRWQGNTNCIKTKVWWNTNNVRRKTNLNLVSTLVQLAH